MPYLFELHYHTPQTSPCGVVPPEEALPRYRQAGYAGVVVTDHYIGSIFHAYGSLPWAAKADRWLAGYRAAKAVAPKGFQVLLGMELRFEDNENDHLVYGFDEAFLYEHPELDKMGFAAFSVFAKEHGLFFAQAHPFRKVCTPREAALLDGVEVYNGNLRWNSRNALAAAFAKQNGLVMFAGSDFHEWEDLCRGGVSFPTCPANEKELALLLHENQIVSLRQLPVPGFWARMAGKLGVKKQ